MDDMPTIAVTPNLFVGTEPPNVSGEFILVSTWNEAAQVLMERGLTNEEAWNRIHAVKMGVGYDAETFKPSPGQDIF